MRCLSCDAALNDREATRKSAVTGEFIDLCNKCFETIKEDIDVIESQFTQEPDDESI